MRFPLLIAPAAIGALVASVVTLTPSLAAAESGVPYDAGSFCSLLPPSDVIELPEDAPIAFRLRGEPTTTTVAVDGVPTAATFGIQSYYGYLQPAAPLPRGEHLLEIKYNCSTSGPATTLKVKATITAAGPKPTTFGAIHAELVDDELVVPLDDIDPATFAYRYAIGVDLETPDRGRLYGNFASSFLGNDLSRPYTYLPLQWAYICRGKPPLVEISLSFRATVIGGLPLPPATTSVLANCAGRVFADDAGTSRDAGASDGGGASGDPDAPGYLAGEDDILEDDDGSGCALGTGRALPYTPLLGALAMMLVGIVRRRTS